MGNDLRIGAKATVQRKGFPFSIQNIAADHLVSLPYMDNARIGGLGICGPGSYMSVAGVREHRIKAITAIVPVISDISTSAKGGFLRPEA